MSQSQLDNLEPSGRTSGTTLGRYELLTKFATGGMAELFLAREHGAGGLERVVVIKRLLPHLAERPESVEMFSREGRLVARLQHPNVVQTHEFGEDGGEYFLAMEYLHGSTLRELQWLADGHLPLWFAVSAIEQACRGLHAAHELRDLGGDPVKLIHRDVSPQNLMCTVDGYVKLLDFGVAKGAEGEEATHSGNIRGKFAYMSPEQFNRVPLDRRSDIFALGVVSWDLLTGERLFKRKTEPRTMEAILEEQPPPPSSVAPQVPESFDSVLEEALEKDREGRPETAEVFRERLVEVAERHDLLRDEKELAQFVRSVADDRLATRDVMIKESLERSLTTHERARLRHEQEVSATESRAPESLLSDGRTPGSVPDASFEESDGGANAFGPTRTDEPPAPKSTTERSPPAETRTSDGSNRRRNLLAAVLAGSMLVVAAAVLFWPGADERSAGPDDGAQGAPEVSGPPLSYVFPPVQTEEVLQAELAPLAEYLERNIGRPVQTVISESYADASRGLRSGRYDVATLPPLTFVLTQRAEPGVEALAIREEAGAITNDGLILVRKASDIHRLEELRGATFCFTDRTSTSGNFLPRVELAKRGWEPEEFIGKVHWSGNHLQGLRDLEDGKCDAAATYSGSLLSGQNRGVHASKLRTVAITGHLPSGTLTVRPGLSDQLVERLVSAHLQFDPEKHLGTDSLGKTLEITGYREPSKELFEPLVRAVKNHSDLLARTGIAETVELSDDAGTSPPSIDSPGN